MNVGFIGAGKVGFSLGRYFALNNHNVTGYYSEISEDALEAAEFTGSKYYEDIESLVKDSEVLFLTVTDGQIGNVWSQLKNLFETKKAENQNAFKSHFSNKVVCHTSGALTSEIFSDIAQYGNYGYSIHPLFAVSDKYNSYKELSNSYFTIEGSSEKLKDIKKMLEDMGNHVCVIEKENKTKYHGAAAIISNLVAGLIFTGENLLMECGFDKESAHNALSPIIMGNIHHIIDGGVVKALTGPIERNDIDTVKKHLSVFNGNVKDMYRTVSLQVLKIAKEKNKDRDYSKMEELLK